MRALIVDDELHGQEALSALLHIHCPQVRVEAFAHSSPAAAEHVRRLRPDLVFLDIEMPSDSGFRLFDTTADIPFRVIFVTAHEQYALRAIKANAVDYLLKPINSIELKGAVTKAQQAVYALHNPTASQTPGSFHPPAANRTLALPTEDGFIFVKTQSIMRLQAASNYTRFYFTDGSSELVSRTLGEYVELLESAGFYRVHHSHLINMNYVRRYRKGRVGSVTLQDGTAIDVSVRRKEGFLERFTR